MTPYRYVIITAARNEAEYIDQTIRCVLAQTVLPLKWIIISNGSTDDTEEIVRRHARKTSFLELMQFDTASSRNFAVKAQALRKAYQSLEGLDYDFLANLDADITLQPDYYESILTKLANNPGMGIAGGIYLDRTANGFRSERTDLQYPPGAIHVFRRECFEAIEGYPLLQWGGEDTAASVMARLKGWQTSAFPHIQVLHQRPWGAGGGGSLLQGRYRQGKMDYHLGMHPLFALAKALGRLTENPLLFGAFGRLAGYLVSWFRREERHVSNEFVAAIRAEQKKKMLSLFNQHKPESCEIKHEERVS